MQLGTAEVLVKAKTSQFDQGISRSEGKIIQFGKAADKSTARAQKSITKFDKATRKVAGSVSGAMENMAGRAGGLGSAFAGINPIAAGITATIMATGAAIFKCSQLADEWDRKLKQTSAILQSTGYAAGLTAAELDELAKERDLATLGDKTEILSGINVLLTFKSVQEDVFTRAIELSQDMATVTGQNLTSSVTMLGKALENPIKGLSAMARVGVTFTEAEQEKIKALAESNKLMEAQTIILDALAGQYGGAAAAEADSLAGSLDSLSFHYREFLETLEQTNAMRVAVDALAGAFEGLTHSMKGPSAEERKAELETQIEQLRLLTEATEAANSQGPDYTYGRGGWGRTGQSPYIKDMQQGRAERLKQLEAEYALLVRNMNTEARVLELEQGRVSTPPPAVATGLTDAEQADLDAFNKAHRKATMEQTEFEIDEIKRQADAYRKSGYDKIKIAEWEAKEIKKIRDKANKDKLDTLAEFDTAYNEMTMTEKELAMAAANAQAEAWETAGADMDKVQHWLSKEHEKIAEKYAEDADALAEAWGGAMDTMSGAIGDMVDTGSDYLDQLILKFAEVAMQEAYDSGGSDLLSGLIAFGGGGFSDFWASIFHEGGTVGGPAPMRAVDPSIYAGAPRYHGGLYPGERPAILETGEIVVPAPHKLGRATGLGSGRPVVNVYDHTDSGAKISTKESQAPGGQWQVDIILEEIDKEMANGITQGTSRTAAALANTYGSQRGLGGR